MKHLPVRLARITSIVALASALGFAGFAQADDANAPIAATDPAQPVKLACVGDSITAGAGAKVSYPIQLKAILGPNWKVTNFGVSGATLLNTGDKPYQKTAAFPKALAYLPNVVVIMLGTNDTKSQNWKFKDQFVADYKDLIGKFKALSSQPRIFIALPVPVVGEGRFGINEPTLEEEMPLITALAQDQNVGLIDLHAALTGHDADFPDHVHPNDEGAHFLALGVAKSLTGKDPTP